MHSKEQRWTTYIYNIIAEQFLDFWTRLRVGLNEAELSTLLRSASSLIPDIASLLGRSLYYLTVFRLCRHFCPTWPLLSYNCSSNCPDNFNQSSLVEMVDLMLTHWLDAFAATIIILMITWSSIADQTFSLCILHFMLCYRWLKWLLT